MILVLLLAAIASGVEGRLLHRAVNSSQAHPRRDVLPCSTPTAKAPVVLPSSVAGQLVLANKMYSGYVSPDDKKHLFYWLFEADAAAGDDAPLILWTNGGPVQTALEVTACAAVSQFAAHAGCSSMEGATTEISPLTLVDIKADARLSAGTLSRNPYGWTRRGHLLFLDQPGPVGYSFGDTVTSSRQAGLDVVEFLKRWLTLFPAFHGRALLIAGESYAGHYLPAVSAALLAAGSLVQLNFRGIVLGNGCVDNAQDADMTSYLRFAQQQQLVPPAFASEQDIDGAIVANLGYTPNYYDFRVRDIPNNAICPGCYGYDYTPWSQWLRQPAVMDALHVCGDAGADAFSDAAGGCIGLPGFDDEVPEFAYRKALAAALDAGVAVTFYYGDADTACNYVGGHAVAESLEWAGREAFSKAPLEVFTVADVPAGRVQQHGLLSFVQIYAAGHMVPADQPAAALFPLQQTLSALGMLRVDNCTASAPITATGPAVVAASVLGAGLIVALVVTVAWACHVRRASARFVLTPMNAAISECSMAPPPGVDDDDPLAVPH